MAANPDLPAPPRLLRRSFALFLVALVVIVLTFLAIFAVSLYGAGRNNVVSKAAALEQYVARSLDVSAIVARDALAYLERRGTLESLDQDRDAHRYLADLAAAMSITEGMIFVNREGRVVLHSGSFPANPVDLSDRDWFRAHMAGAERYIDGSFVSRVTGTLLFVHTFALRDEADALLGVINIGIPSNVLLGAQALPFEGQGIVTEVAKLSGEVIARDPFPDDLVGVRVAVPDGIPEGSAILERRADGRRAITAYSTLPAYGLVASVSVPLAVVLQPLWVTAATTLPLLALIVIGGIATLRHLEAHQKQLARGAVRLEAVLRASSLGAWQWLPKRGTHECLGGCAAMLGYPVEDLAPYDDAWERLLHPDERDRLVDRFDRLLKGETEDFREEHRMRHRDGYWIWVLDSRSVVERDAEGRPEVVLGIQLDISERRAAEERMRTISLEVDHRSKNLLAVVQSLVSMTRLDSEEGFKTTLRGRIQALSRAHELLSRSRWTGADLRVIAEEELRPYSGGRTTDIEIEGPQTFLGAASIQALAMTLHELATNAAKHGALAEPGGRLRLTWRVPEEGPDIEIVWEETVAGGAGDAHLGAGFGSRLMHLMIETQLEGSLETEMRAEGLVCTMRVPRTLLLHAAADPPPVAPARPAPADALRPAGEALRLLLVEDEALVAAETAARLAADGHAVTARASNVPDAMKLAATADVDAAILDLNLHGELSFPVADLLQGRGIPFVFLTGYEHESIVPRRFADAAILRKPCAPDALERTLARLTAAKVAESGPPRAVSSG